MILMQSLGTVRLFVMVFLPHGWHRARSGFAVDETQAFLERRIVDDPYYLVSRVADRRDSGTLSN